MNMYLIDGNDWVVASSEADAVSAAEENYGETLEEMSGEVPEVELLSPDRKVTVQNHNDTGESLTLTCAEWIARDGRGLLCSVNW